MPSRSCVLSLISWLGAVVVVVNNGGGGSGTVRAEEIIEAAAADVDPAAVRASPPTVGAISAVSVADAGIPVDENVPRPPLAVGLGESPSLARFSASFIRHETCFATVESVRFSSSALRARVSPPDGSLVGQKLFRCGEIAFRKPARAARASWACNVRFKESVILQVHVCT